MNSHSQASCPIRLRLTLSAFLVFLVAALVSAQTTPDGDSGAPTYQVLYAFTGGSDGGGAHTPRCGSGDAFEPGVDLDNGGYAKINGQDQDICNISITINGTQDPDHSYQDQNNNDYGWLDQYDNGNMDGFCEIYQNGQCLQYSYVQKFDVQPYFDIATAYGFANYMFQTNEGPSYPAHQFLFSGTSAPTAPPNADFVAENGSGGINSSGCASGANANVVNPNGVEGSGPAECYPHDSLVTNSSGDKGITWRYYAPTAGAIWTAPASIPEVCYGTNIGYTEGQPCSGPEWSNHVVLPDTLSHGGSAPILSDIENCNLQQISWAVPDEEWSDHAGGNAPPPPAPPYGPSWVANIIDAVGQSACTDQNGSTYWQDTVIFVVWDDWGGWFDHVSPVTGPGFWRDNQQGECLEPNGWGCGYTYGFRVPLLVVSAYTPAKYVSGSCTSDCPNANFPYVHDFGSILAFTEWNFGLQFIDQSGDNGYADRNAPDGADGNVPLSDFFSLSNPRNFTAISTPYSAGFFESYYFNNQNYTPTGPDGNPDD